MKLIRYDENDVSENQLEDYYLPEEQEIFSALPKDAVLRAKEDPDVHPVCLMDETRQNLLVFFLLHEKEGVKPYSENPNSILLRSFSTNFKFQGHGHAQTSLNLLDSYVRTHFPSINEIILGVNAKNIPAINLYKKCGYIHELKRMTTEYGQLIVLSKKLK